MVQWFSISEFDSEDVGSNPAPIANVGFRLIGKASVCATEDQGSNPKVNQVRNELAYSSTDENTSLRMKRYKFESC